MSKFGFSDRDLEVINDKTDLDDEMWCEKCSHFAEDGCECELCKLILESI